MSARDFRFVDFEPTQQTRGRNELYAAFREALKARPGEWAEWPREVKHAGQVAGNVNRGKQPWKGFEAASSGGRVYARYVGDGEAAS